MNAKDILARRFEKATFNGYKTEDVDEFLRELSGEFAQLQKEKGELERKLEVLADKIREYRDDEDALKDALLMAQKQGNHIISESKQAADKLTKETDEAVEKKLAETKEKADKMMKDADEYAKRMTKESNERADKLVKDARAKADEIRELMQRQTEIQQTVLQRTRKEADEYRKKLVTAYNAQIEIAKKQADQYKEKMVKEYADLADAAKKRAEEYEKKMVEEFTTLIAETKKNSAEYRDKMVEEFTSLSDEAKKQSDDYREKTVGDYTAQIELINKLPEACENEFVKATAAEVEKREAEKAKQAAARKAAEPKPQPKPRPEQKKPDAKQAYNSEIKGAVKITEEMDEADAKGSEKPVVKTAAQKPQDEPFKSLPEDDTDRAKTGEFDMPPFFSAQGEKKKRHGDLQFGKRK